MERRIALAISMILVGVAFTSMLMGVGSAQSGTTTYTFEECEEGWTVVSESENPLTAGTWELAAPGDESEMAWHIAGGPGGGEEESLTSPAHAVTGTAVTITYKIAHDTTTEQVIVEWSSDGETWEALEGKTYEGTNEGNPAFISDTATFTPPAGEVQIRFRWSSALDLTPGGSTADVDNVTINRPRPADATCEEASASPSASTTAEPSGSPTGSPDPSASPSPSVSPTEPPDDERGCTVSGTEDDDTLVGTPGDDIICGYAGADEIKGRGGNDKLYGDEGGDDIRGNKGNDRLKGGGGGDNLRGGSGNDRHNGGGGSDSCKDDKGSNRFQSCEN